MIHSLELALRMRTEIRASEFVVSRQVFLQVVAEAAQEASFRIVLDAPYAGEGFSFINRALVSGALFVHISNERLGTCLSRVLRRRAEERLRAQHRCALQINLCQLVDH